MAAPDVVVLSPHLDDAVLSVGAHLARLTRSGRRVEVWTAFTAAPDLARFPARWHAFGDYATRCAEDDRALDRLGCGRRRLDLPERVWREPRPRTLAGAFRGPDAVEGFSCLPVLREVLAEALARPGVAHVYAPLGIGGHADHLEVAVAAMQAAAGGLAAGGSAGEGPAGRLVFYEDFYALGETFRRRHPVSRKAAEPLAARPCWVAPGLGAALAAMAVGTRGPGLATYVPTAARLEWTCERAAVGEFEADKLAAVAEYASQVPRLGGRGLARALRRAHRVRGGELLWRAGEGRGAS